MTDENTRLFDSIIDELHLEQATGMSREQLHKAVNVVAVKMDLCYVLADVIDSLMIDIDDAIKRIYNPFDERDRSAFKELRTLIRATRTRARLACRTMNLSKDASSFCMESDWWLKLILMVEDRTGTDELKTKQVIRWLSTIPSQLGLFDKIHTKDFTRLSDR